ncbi:hypothetical protein KUV64_22080 [Mameliella alba]|uniref:hypothetical protein n=1 Tax=Mameliella alba TaxID=561184 RepID=UPI001C970C15|nr:hypothetical protein [Mameliella alba]MBY6121827.1 hypothetical protein [Mameliella alba]
MTAPACDICGADRAPFGYAPPPALCIKIKRPLRTCGALACRDAAEARRAALIERNDPLARPDRTAARPADPAQGSLFG